MIPGELKAGLEKFNCCIVIPTFNNAKTLSNLLLDLSILSDRLIVVNDGSTDETSEVLGQYENTGIIQFEKNRGKGAALKAGFREAVKQGYDRAITMDSDSQHSPEDLKNFLDALVEQPDALIVGSRDLEAENMPGKNTFGNRFSNFWFVVETGKKLPDTQSGYRLYPLHKMRGMKFYGGKYEFEFEVLVRLSWRGIPVIPVTVSVYYPPDGERISHFRPFRDFFRISVLNSILTIMGILIFRPLLFFRSLTKGNIKDFIRREVVRSEEGNAKKATAIGFGVFMGIVPVWGYQMILSVLFAHWLKLNKAIVLLSSNISLGPMMPVIIFLSYMFGSVFVSNPEMLVPNFEEIDLSVIKNQIIQYLIGSIALAISTGLGFGLVSYLILNFLRKDGRVKTE